MVKFDKKIIAVIGATGKQGGGLVKAILQDPESPFTIRALTRDPSKGAAVALQEQGAEVVAFDMDSHPTEMEKALEGVHGLYVVTNFWEHYDHEREMRQARSVVEAGETAGVKHFVWSTLEDTRPFFDGLPESERPPKLNGTYVPHFDAKGATNQYFPADKTTILYTSFYLENLYNYGCVKNGNFSVNLDDVELPVIAIDDIGKCTYEIFKAGEEYMGSTVHLAGERITVKDMMKVASEVTGEGFEYTNVPRNEYASVSGSEEFANMYEYMRLNPAYVDALDPKEAQKIYSGVQSVRSFMKSHKELIMPLSAAN